MNSRLPPEKSAFRLSLASYVVGIRDGWRRMRGGPVRRVTDHKSGTQENEEHPAVNATGNPRQETPVRRTRTRGSQTSFEKFLHSLPKVDTIDRTVDWVLAQPVDIEEREPDRFANLPVHGILFPRLTSAASSRMNMLSTKDNEEESLSRYESERGTAGRGTPPEKKEGQPRLDLLLQQTYIYQERKAILEINKERKLSSLQSAQIPDPTLDCQEQKKYQNPLSTGEDVVVCGWGECRVTVTSRGHLMMHVADHIHSRRSVGQFWCRWRGCQQGARMWRNRQTLLHHINKSHCNNTRTPQNMQEVESTAHHGCNGFLRGVDERRATRTTTVTAKPQMTMVTGLQIKPALVIKKDKQKK